MGSQYSASFYFSGGLEDIDLNVGYAIDRWRTDSSLNYGFILAYDSVISGNEGTFFTKKFLEEQANITLRDLISRLDGILEEKIIGLTFWSAVLWQLHLTT